MLSGLSLKSISFAIFTSDLFAVVMTLNAGIWDFISLVSGKKINRVWADKKGVNQGFFEDDYAKHQSNET